MFPPVDLGAMSGERSTGSVPATRRRRSLSRTAEEPVHNFAGRPPWRTLCHDSGRISDWVVKLIDCLTGPCGRPIPENGCLQPADCGGHFSRGRYPRSSPDPKAIEAGKAPDLPGFALPARRNHVGFCPATASCSRLHSAGSRPFFLRPAPRRLCRNTFSGPSLGISEGDGSGVPRGRVGERGGVAGGWRKSSSQGNSRSRFLLVFNAPARLPLGCKDSPFNPAPPPLPAKFNEFQLTGRANTTLSRLWPAVSTALRRRFHPPTFSCPPSASILSASLAQVDQPTCRRRCRQNLAGDQPA